MNINEKLKILLIKSNFLFPHILGYRYYKHLIRINRNYFSYNNTADLIKIVNYANKFVPFYNHHSNHSIESLDEFCKYQNFIDKDIVMANWHDFILPKTTQRKTIIASTGGTSGKQMQIVLPKNRYYYELSTMYKMWSNIGWNGEIRGVIRNKKLKNDQNFIIDPIKREVIFDGFRTSKEYFYVVYNFLKENNIKYIHAYPSSAYQFSRFLYNENLDVSFIKGFFCGSEGLLNEQKILIQEGLGIKIYHWYGHSEKLVLGGYCEKSEFIHIEPTYGYFELIDQDGNAIEQIGKKGEIVGTGLHNRFMPLIRYRTGDFAEYVGNYCPHCKRELPLIKNIEGRWSNNKIFYKDGSYTSITALNLHDDLYFFIEGMQYIQKEFGKLEILIVKGKGFNSEIEKRFYNHFESALRENCSFNIKFVNQLEKEKNGKFLPLKQFIKKSI